MILRLAQTQNLGRREAVAGNCAAGAFDPDHRFVGLWPGGDQDSVDLRAKPLDRARAHVSLEGQDKDALSRLLIAPRLGGRLGLFLPAFGERLEFLPVEQLAVHGVAHVVIALVERADLDLRVLGFVRAREARDQHGEAANRRDDDHGLQDKGRDV